MLSKTDNSIKRFRVLLLLFVLLHLAKPSLLRAQPNTILDISESGFFDNTNKAYLIQDGCVSVDLGQQLVLCPTGLGHLASGKELVRQIQFIFNSSAAGDY